MQDLSQGLGYCECGAEVAPSEDFCWTCLGIEPPPPEEDSWGPEVRAFYSRKLLDRLVPALAHADHGTQEDVSANRAIVPVRSNSDLGRDMHRGSPDPKLVRRFETFSDPLVGLS